MKQTKAVKPPKSTKGVSQGKSIGLTTWARGAEIHAAFREANQIVNPAGIGVQRPVAISCDPVTGSVQIQIDPGQLSHQQLVDLMMWKMRWSGDHA